MALNIMEHNDSVREQAIELPIALFFDHAYLYGPKWHVFLYYFIPSRSKSHVGEQNITMGIKKYFKGIK